MSEEIEVSEDLIDDYTQVGNSDRANVLTPGEDKQVVDMTELFKDEGSKDYKTVITGVEQLRLGTISRRVSEYFGLTGKEQLDPFPSELNLYRVSGKEGFFTSILTGIEKAITWVIKFVTNGIRWIINMFKTILGITPSERQAKVIDEGVEKLETIMSDVADRLGVSRTVLDPKANLGNLPKGLKTAPLLNLIKSRVVSDDDHIKAVFEVSSLVPKINKKIMGAQSVLNKAIANYNRVIDEQYAKYLKVANSRNGNLTANHTGEHEIIAIKEALINARVAANIDDVIEPIKEFLSKLYDVKFSEKETQDAISSISKQLNENVAVATYNITQGGFLVSGGTRTAVINSADHDLWTNESAIIAQAKAAINTNDIKLNAKDWGELANFAHVDKANRVAEIGQFYGDQVLLPLYMETIDVTKEFVGYVSLVSRELLRYKQQVEEIIQYQARIKVFIMGLLAKDLNALAAVGMNQNSYNLNLLSEANAQTILEKIAATTNVVITDEAMGITKVYNNLAKQLRLDTL